MHPRAHRARLERRQPSQQRFAVGDAQLYFNFFVWEYSQFPPQLPAGFVPENPWRFMAAV
jgi:hypothetical protein